jgi:CheY-like chemotaxis protein
VVLTAHASEAQRQACLAAGVDAFLGKPFECRDLDAALDGVLAGSAAGAEPATPGPRSSEPASPGRGGG